MTRKRSPRPEERASGRAACHCSATTWQRLEARPRSPDELLLLNDALDKLAEEDPPCAELVKLRFFAGLTLDEAAKALGVVRRTADRYWAFGRSWLYAAMRKAEEAAES